MFQDQFPRLALLCVIAVLAAGSARAASPAKLDLTDPKQRLSYALGTGIGNSIKAQGVEIDPNVVAVGIADAIAGKLALTDAEIRATMDEVRDGLIAKQQAKQEADAKANTKAGSDYLAANAKRAGVKTTASGLQYKVVKSGTGKTPGPTDTVKVHYRGTLISGAVFDSSIDRGEPVSFQVNGVIAGWTEVLQLMKEGDEWEVYIPSDLAYGASGAGDKIQPNSVLVFDIRLLTVGK
jgi:FKBP-type peptidyl-prolyl cis-trans isomerase FklB